jgi:hypothetical protein
MWELGAALGLVLLAGCSSQPASTSPPPAVATAAPLPPGTMVTVPVPPGAVETPCPDTMPANYTPLRCFKDADGQWHGGGGMPAATLPPGLPVSLLVPAGAQVVECDTPPPPPESGAGKVCYISDKGMPGSSAWTT